MPVFCQTPAGADSAAPDSVPLPEIEISFDLRAPAVKEFKVGDTLRLDAVAAWEGKKDYYTLKVPQDPVCKNLTVVGRKTLNRVRPAPGRGMACQTIYTYFLTAEAPGPAAVEGMTLYYTSLADQTEQPLSVRGIELTVLPAARGSSVLGIIIIVLAVLAAAGLIVLFIFRKKLRLKAQAKESPGDSTDALIAELEKTRKFLTEGNTSEYFTGLFRVTKKAACFHLKLGDTEDTAVLIKKLRESGGDSAQQAAGLVERLEALRFSGTRPLPEELDRLKFEIEKTVRALMG